MRLVYRCRIPYLMQRMVVDTIQHTTCNHQKQSWWLSHDMTTRWWSLVTRQHYRYSQCDWRTNRASRCKNMPALEHPIDFTRDPEPAHVPVGHNTGPSPALALQAQAELFFSSVLLSCLTPEPTSQCSGFCTFAACERNLSCRLRCCYALHPTSPTYSTSFVF